MQSMVESERAEGGRSSRSSSNVASLAAMAH